MRRSAHATLDPPTLVTVVLRLSKMKMTQVTACF